MTTQSTPVLEAYMNAWVAGNPQQIADLVSVDCVITECYGPVYRGRERVFQWADQWFSERGMVHSWQISSSFTAPGREVAEWVFDFTWQGRRRSFEGASIATVDGGLITSLREYRTTGELYDWTGTWL
ncbi:nuclear transport factor 2 family protein [Nesterenkonia alkaliphila]|nr:nuclear transport factor 2 family protein [Nesterenkonia alkaliphila]GFZ91513.1 hypothetical protein GCM10011359_21080 [Nesterenkonia alkaliphila]